MRFLLSMQKTFRPLQQFLKRFGCYLKNSHTPVTQWSETLWHCGISKSTAFTATAFHAYYINLHALIVHFWFLCWWNVGLPSFAFDIRKVCNKIFICAFTVIAGEYIKIHMMAYPLCKKKTIYEKQQSWLPHDINKRGCTCNLRREQPDTTRVRMNRLLYQHKRMWDN